MPLNSVEFLRFWLSSACTVLVLVLLLQAIRDRSHWLYVAIQGVLLSLQLALFLSRIVDALKG